MIGRILVLVCLLNSETFCFSQASDCSNAQVLNPTVDCCNPFTFNLAHTNSALSDVNCVGNINSDGWFRFVASGSLSTLTVSNASDNIAVVIYEGDCSALTALTCVDDNATGSVLKAITTPGNTYFIRLIQTGVNAANTTGDLCLTSLSNNLVVNGDFAQGSLAWSSCGNNSEILNSGAWHGGPPVANFAEVDADLDEIVGTPDDMILCQDVAGFVVGQEYLFSINFQRRPGPSDCVDFFNFPLNVTSIINIDNALTNVNITEDNSVWVWREVTYAFTATSTNHQLRITPFDASSCGMLVTNISISPILVPQNIQTEDKIVCFGASYTYPDGTLHSNITANESHTSVFSNPNGCDSTVITNLTVEIPQVSAGADVAACEGSTISLTATGNGVLTWNNGVVNGIAFQGLLGSNQYVATVLTTNGCQTSDTLTVVIHPTPVPLFTSNVQQGCESLPVVFSNLSNDSQSCIWNFGNGESSSSCSPQEVVYVNDGSYDVALTVTDSHGCTGTSSLSGFIVVHPKPIASYIPNSMYFGFDNSEILFQNTSIDASIYEWNFGDGSATNFEFSPEHSFVNSESNVLVTLTAKNQFDCADTFQLILVYKSILTFYVPNTFTPDGNEYNNLFVPVFSEGFIPREYHLKVFDRWGELLFESFDYQNGWDGSFGKKLVQDGVYVWEIGFKNDKDEQEVFNGHITVIK